jgi:hypothetical protein
VTLALMDIGAVDACGFDSDQNLALRRNGTRAQLNFERLRAAWAGRDNCAHSLALISHLTLLAIRPDRSLRLAAFRQSPIAEAVAHPPAERREMREALSARAQNVPRLTQEFSLQCTQTRGQLTYNPVDPGSCCFFDWAQRTLAVALQLFP